MDSINTTVELRVDTEKPFNCFAWLFIFDFRGLLQGGYSLEKPMTLKLMSGLYKFRIELNYDIIDYTLDISKDRSIYIGYNKPEAGEDLFLLLNKIYSCLPLNLSINSTLHLEYLEDPWSQTVITNPNRLNTHADIHIYFLLSGEVSDLTNLLEEHRIILYDSFGDMLASQTNLSVESARDKPVIVSYNNSLEVDTYFLELDSRIIPFTLIARQRTNIFITFSENRFQISTLRIVNLQYGEYNSGDPGLIIIELLLNRMHNNNYSLPASLVSYVLTLNTQCSTLYLLCIYLLCQNKELNPDNFDIKQLDRKLTKDNKGYILDLPDYVVIRSILDDKRNKTPLYTTEMPPMFRIGYENLLQLGVRHDNVIPTGTINAALMGEILYDAVINTFSTNNLKEILQSGLRGRPYYTDHNDQEISVLEGLDDNTFTQIIQQLSEGLFDNDWLGTSIATHLKQHYYITVSGISASIQLPKAIVFSKIQSMKRQLIEEKELEYSWK